MRVDDTFKLHTVKTVHTTIYLTMVAAIFYILFAGITKTHNSMLFISLGLVSLEGIVFFGNGMRCPLTSMAQKYGDPKGYVGDTYFSERFTGYTFEIFGSILATALLVLVLNW